MKGVPACCLTRTMVDLRSMFVVLAFLLLSACGGGSSQNSNPNSNPNVIMSVSPQTVSVSATTTQSAVSSAFQVNVTGLGQDQIVYLAARVIGSGISSVINNGGTLPATIPILFDSPSALGPGTYAGGVQVEMCFDRACSKPLVNSPQTVQVTYTVTRSTFAVTGVSPSSGYAGAQSFVLTVDGSTFSPHSTVLWNGTQLRSTFVSGSRLTAQVPAADITRTGSAAVSVSDPANGTSNAETFTIRPSPITLTSLSPTSAYIGGPVFTLTLTGSGFTSQSTVLWNGSPQPTTFVSATKLTAQISASEIVATGSEAVSVSDPTFGLSTSLMFTVAPTPLALNSISPSTVTVGGPSFTLTALGTAFTGTSIVEWNGTALTTTFVSSKELIAQVPAGDINAVSTASVIVSDPNSPPGTTGTQTLTIAPPSIDAVSFQINSAHNGAVNFANMSLPFPSSPAWSKDVGGTPSYALITSGKVIVTVQVSGGGYTLVALNQADGSPAWAPVTLSSVTNATYDNGRVFVLSGSSAAILEAFDVNTGTLDWSTQLTGRKIFASLLLTATDGNVYVGTEGTVDAVEESTGTLLWAKDVGGTEMSPTATADGVYTSFFCDTLDLRPATGELIWNSPPTCTGGGGGPVSVVANQLVYAPNDSFGYSGGVYDAETGANDGTYSADAPPAFTASMGYFMQGGTLRGITLADNTVQWSFTGDGHLVGAAIVVNQDVFIGSSSGNLYAVDGTNGMQVWMVTLSAAIASLPFAGLAAGDGLLVVPSGTTVTAYVLSTNP